MTKSYQILVIIALGLSVFACSNNPLNSTDPEEETPAIEHSQDGYDFRDVRWGMSKEEVMSTEEGEPVFKSENKIDYNKQMYGMEGEVGYTFKDDELIRAGFFVLAKPEDNNEYINIYKGIQKELKKKYGKTVIDTVQHKDPSERIDPSAHGEAACNGQLLYATQWDLPASDVQLLLRGENSECVITILYLSEEGFRQMMQDRNSQ